jgi:hypothetical protein
MSHKTGSNDRTHHSSLITENKPNSATDKAPPMSVPLSHYPPVFWLIAPLAILILGIDKAGFGGGIGIVSTPLIALAIPVPEAAALMLPILLVADFFSLRHYYRTFDRASLRVLLPGSVLVCSPFCLSCIRRCGL